MLVAPSPMRKAYSRYKSDSDRKLNTVKPVQESMRVTLNDAESNLPQSRLKTNVKQEKL